MHFTRNVHTVLGSMLLYRIFREASVGCCCCYFCAGDIITKKKSNRCSGKYTGFVISKNLTYYIKKDNIYCLVTLISDQYLCHLHEKNLWVLLADSGFNTIIPQT